MAVRGTGREYFGAKYFLDLHEGVGVLGQGDLGVLGQGYENGVLGFTDMGNENPERPSPAGVKGVAAGTFGVGTKGAASGRGGFGVAGSAYGNPEGDHQAIGVAGVAMNKQALAGWFRGKVVVEGELVKASGGFLIDHPLDPETRYLYHSFVESPERLNVYSGTVVTGTDGSVVVELPEYFEALNADFRYQLTVIGGFAQAVVSEEVQDNHFTISTDRPEMKVSWQVTGVRKDPYARESLCRGTREVRRRARQIPPS